MPTYKVPAGYVTKNGKNVECEIACEDLPGCNKGGLITLYSLYETTTQKCLGKITLKNCTVSGVFSGYVIEHVYDGVQNPDEKEYKREYQGIGTTLYQIAIEESKIRGFNGELFLSAIGTSLGFHRKMGCYAYYPNVKNGGITFDVELNSELDRCIKAGEIYDSSDRKKGHSSSWMTLKPDAIANSELWKKRLAQPILSAPIISEKDKLSAQPAKPKTTISIMIPPVIAASTSATPPTPKPTNTTSSPLPSAQAVDDSERMVAKKPM
jgi:hypothetical protein